jgi:hypothetical protein
MTTHHRVRSSFAVAVAIATVAFAGYVKLDPEGHVAGQAAVAAPVQPAEDSSSGEWNDAPAMSPGARAVLIQEQADLDLVGASIGAYDR